MPLNKADQKKLEEIEAREAAHKLHDLMQDRVSSSHQASKTDPAWCQARHSYILYRDLALKVSSFFTSHIRE